MMMTPALRRFTFTTHVTSSAGWVGAVLVFLALAVIGLTSPDERTVRGAYLVMAPAAWFVLVPLAHASLLSGIALSLGSTWGLFRHYWVAVKLVITAFATAILLIYMGTFREMAGVAADPVVALGLVRNPSPMAHSILALVLLIAATVLAVYKPFGRTPYGRRQEGERRQISHLVSTQERAEIKVARAAAILETSAQKSNTATPAWVYASWIFAVALIAVFLALHFLLGGAAGL